MRLLFVSNLAGSRQRAFALKWGSAMKLLFATELSRHARSTYTLTKYVEVGKALGHDVALFGERSADIPLLPYTLDVEKFDFVIFVIHVPSDFPDLPYLARLLDQMPKDRRVVIDCLGRYNETVRIEHDFNHLEKMDGHQGWEWVEGFEAVSNTILQPTQKPLRSGVRSFLWHAFDPASVVKPYAKEQEAVQSWSSSDRNAKPYAMTYVGHNWQRWTQIRKLLEGVQPLSADFGPIAFAGSDWEKRPDWAAQLGLQGVDVDPELFARARVQLRPPIPFQEMIGLLSQGRFCPVVQRPLFNEL